jgi:hypothetical protein
MAEDQDCQVLGTLIRAPAYEPAREALHDEGQEEDHRAVIKGDRRFRHEPDFPTPTGSGFRSRKVTSPDPRLHAH